MQRARLNFHLVLVVALMIGSMQCACFAQSAHDNVVIVLDGSGSMKKPMGSTGMRRMAAAKQALKGVLDRVPESTHIGLLVFTSNRGNGWAYPIGPRDDAKLRTVIDSIQPGGGTPLGKSMKTGVDELMKTREKQFGYGSYKLLIVTDGEANDQPDVERYTKDILTRGLRVDVIGVDMKKDHTLAKKAHSYRKADDNASLQQALTEVFAEVSLSDDGASSDDAFEVLAAIPVEVAATLISGLAKQDNSPIGTAKRGAAQAQPPATAPKTQRPPKASPAQQPAPTSPRGRSQSPLGLGVSFWVLIVLVVIVVALIKGLTRRRS